MPPADPAHSSPDPTLGHRERKKRETRAALVDAALTLIAERGLENVTVDEIAAAAGVSGRTFFNYFPTKEDAVTGFGEEGIARTCRAVLDAPSELSALAAFRLAVLAEAKHIELNPTHLTLQMQIAERSPSLWPRLIAGGENALREMAAAIGERTGVDPVEHDFPGLLAQIGGAAFRNAVLRWHQSGFSRALSDLLNDSFCLIQPDCPTRNQPPPTRNQAPSNPSLRSRPP